MQDDIEWQLRGRGKSPLKCIGAEYTRGKASKGVSDAGHGKQFLKNEVLSLK